MNILDRQIENKAELEIAYVEYKQNGWKACTQVQLAL
jgi:hypothetical protein